MERLVKIIVQAVGSDEARRKVERVIASTQKMEKATAGAVRETKAMNAAAGSWTLLGSRISRAQKEVELFNRSMKKLSQNERDSRFYNFFDNRGIPNNLGGGGADTPGGGGGGAMNRAMRSGRMNQIGSGILGILGSGGRQVIGSSAGAIRTLMGSIGQLAGVSTAAAAAAGGVIGVMLTWPITMGPIISLGKGVKETFHGIMEVFGAVAKAGFVDDITKSFEDVAAAVNPVVDAITSRMGPSFDTLGDRMDSLFIKVGAWAAVTLPVAIEVFSSFVNMMLWSMKQVGMLTAKFDKGALLGFVEAVERDIADEMGKMRAQKRFEGEHLQSPVVDLRGLTQEQKLKAIAEAWEKAKPLPDSFVRANKGFPESSAMAERTIEAEKEKEKREKALERLAAEKERAKEKKMREAEKAETEAERQQNKARIEEERRVRNREQEEDRRLRAAKRQVEYEELEERRRKIGLGGTRPASRYDSGRLIDGTLGRGY